MLSAIERIQALQEEIGLTDEQAVMTLEMLTAHQVQVVMQCAKAIEEDRAGDFGLGPEPVGASRHGWIIVRHMYKKCIELVQKVKFE